VRHERSDRTTLRDIVDRQWGVITLAQLRECGLGDGAIKSWVARGRLIRLYRGVYAVGHARLRPEGLRLAAVLTYGDSAALSYAAAADHLGLRGSSARLIDVSVAGNRRPQPAIRLHRTTFLPGDVIDHGGIATTSPTRTVIDLARILPLPRLEPLVAQAEHRGLLDHRRLARSRSRPLRAIFGHGRPPARTRSRDEARLLAAVRAARLPEPEMNVWLTHGRGEQWQPDLLFRDQRVIVEVDDDRHRTRRAFELDRRKDAVRQADGYRTLRVTRRQIAEDLPSFVALLSRTVARGDGW
jgi:very-short-patch-repair endonuclease